ncbi:MAG: hypothetical protein LLG02_08195 [Pelosinus sp.]|nr:hypothetical protein [Pelosinus sp.]
MTNEEFQKLVLEQFTELKKEIAVIKSDMASKTQQNETTDIVKAIQHNTEVIGAKVDGLTVTTASKEAVADLDAKFDVLNKRLFQQEADLQRLKKAQ